MENSVEANFGGGSGCDNTPTLCRADDKGPSLPRDARLPINRCNLPAVILGSLSYQRNPAPLMLDGVEELHRDLFQRLDRLESPAERALIFQDYVTVHFLLEWPEEAGLTEAGRQRGKARSKATYVRALRGWSFDSDSREGAVLKGWVESRFGLLPRYHGMPLRDPGGDGFRRYTEARAQGLYGTNALEAQFDLLYAYCQYEITRRHPQARHVTLYRGVNRMGDHEVLGTPGERDEAGQGERGIRRIVLFNNLSSFTCNRERASEFGDHILSVDVPLTKILFYCGLLPGLVQGEEEFLVIGGAYEVALSTI